MYMYIIICIYIHINNIIRALTSRDVNVIERNQELWISLTKTPLHRKGLTPRLFISHVHKTVHQEFVCPFLLCSLSELLPTTALQFSGGTPSACRGKDSGYVLHVLLIWSHIDSNIFRPLQVLLLFLVPRPHAFGNFQSISILNSLCTACAK